jgi:hypothetical protein
MAFEKTSIVFCCLRTPNPLLVSPRFGSDTATDYFVRGTQVFAIAFASGSRS